MYNFFLQLLNIQFLQAPLADIKKHAELVR